MPLFKRKPFKLAETPKDLEPCDLVYQVRFTYEIFQDYCEYLNRINLYRQRFWTCKVTGKTNLTYEEALVSEKIAIEKVQQFPKYLMEPVLRIIQFSMLSLKDLADTIAVRLQECLFEGVEMCGKKDDVVYPCKIVKILEGSEKTQYEVFWLDKTKKITGNSMLEEEDLIRKKMPFSRSMLKSFIRDSTYQNAPWVLHPKLAQKHGITSDPPDELRSVVFYSNGLLISNKKRKKTKGEFGEGKRQKEGWGKFGVRTTNSNLKEEVYQDEPVRYPIDDLLLQPEAGNPDFTSRPSPSRDFSVTMDCVGDLLMVWDFCSSFGRLLHLSPFSLEDFENAVCYKDKIPIIIVESHIALLQFLLKDAGEYFLVVQEKKRKFKITLITWSEYLCDFLEMIGIPELYTHIATIRRGHYGLLDAHAKLRIFRELVNQALNKDLTREKLDEHIEQRHAIGATRREEALEEARRKREAKERLNTQSETNEVMDEKCVQSDQNVSNGNHYRQNGYAAKKINRDVVSSRENHVLEMSESKLKDTALKDTPKVQKVNGRVSAGLSKQLTDDKKEASEKSSKEQRKVRFERELEKLLIRTNSLGKDRYYNRYWWFCRDSRIFIESADSEEWGYYSSMEELDALMSSLNHKCEREMALEKQLEKFYSRICSEIKKRSKDVAHEIAVDEGVVRRSTRVRAPPRDNPAKAFLRYVNKWKED